MLIKSSNIVIRNWIKSDATDLAIQGNNKKIARNLVDSFPNPYTLKDAKNWIELNSLNDAKNFAVVIDGKIAGGIGYSNYKKDKTHVVVIGYWLGESYWGKGLGTKVIKMFTKYLFLDKNIKRIEAKVYAWNPISKRVLEKNGFLFEGTLRSITRKGNKIVDEWIFSKIRR